MAELPKLFKAEPGKVNADSYDAETGILKVFVGVGTDAGKYSAFQKKLVAPLDKVSRDKNTAITDVKPTFPKVPVRDEKNWVLWASSCIDCAGDARAMEGLSDGLRPVEVFLRRQWCVLRPCVAPRRGGTSRNGRRNAHHEVEFEERKPHPRGDFASG